MTWHHKVTWVNPMSHLSAAPPPQEPQPLLRPCSFSAPWKGTELRRTASHRLLGGSRAPAWGESGVIDISLIEEWGLFSLQLSDSSTRKD